MAVNIQLRNGTSAQWTSVNPTLMIGELGVETDTSQFKIGNGVLAWNALPYATSSNAYSSSVSITAQTASFLTTTNNYTVSNLIVSGSLIYPRISSSIQSSVLTIDETGSVKKRTYINVITKSVGFNLTSSEEGYYIRYTGASDANVTILSSSVHAMDVNSVFTVMQAGAGIITVTGSAATIVVNGSNKTAGQYKALQIVKFDTDTFDIIGGVV